mmetsp:Transcript_11288/g.20698  ORF Transcript_11288/g.20698 Transcript_11288/m.20698 type:complete len:219 (+) Transcript_11288:563-1219(+)
MVNVYTPGLTQCLKVLWELPSNSGKESPESMVIILSPFGPMRASDHWFTSALSLVLLMTILRWMQEGGGSTTGSSGCLFSDDVLSTVSTTTTSGVVSEGLLLSSVVSVVVPPPEGLEGGGLIFSSPSVSSICMAGLSITCCEDCCASTIAATMVPITTSTRANTNTLHRRVRIRSLHGKYDLRTPTPRSSSSSSSPLALLPLPLLPQLTLRGYPFFGF